MLSEKPYVLDTQSHLGQLISMLIPHYLLKKSTQGITSYLILHTQSIFPITANTPICCVKAELISGLSLPYFTINLALYISKNLQCRQ